MEAHMSSSSDTSAYGRFGTFFLQRSRRSEDMPWSHNAKVLLWVGLATASWVAVILATYFIWSAL